MGALVLAKPTDKDIANIARIEKTIKDNRYPDSRKGAGWHNMSGSIEGRKPMDRRFLKELNKTDNIAVVKQKDEVIGYGVALNSEDRRKGMHQGDVDFKARLCGESEEFTRSTEVGGEFVLVAKGKKGIGEAAAMLLGEIVDMAKKNPQIGHLSSFVSGFLKDAAKEAGMAIDEKASREFLHVSVTFEGKECTPKKGVLVMWVEGKKVTLPDTHENRATVWLRRENAAWQRYKENSGKKYAPNV